LIVMKEVKRKNIKLIIKVMKTTNGLMQIYSFIN
jgi:hypothetical protein